MEISANIFFFLVFVLVGAVLPGALLTAGYFSGTAERPGPEALSALALLAGFTFQITAWFCLRWAGLSYGSVLLCHGVFLGVLSAFVLRPGHGREVLTGILRSVLSAESAVFLLIAAAFAAYFTYNDLQLYHEDELLRLSFAWAAGQGIPAQNMFAHSGVIKYHYATEFFAASAAEITRVPIETVYLRFMLVLDWMLLFFGMRGLVAQLAPGFKRYVPHAAFLLFFLAPAKFLPHFAYRDNTFALGLYALAVPSLLAAVASAKIFPLLTCGAAVALVSFVKAPFGALYLVFFWAFLAVSAWRGRLSWGRAVLGALLGGAAWALVFLSLSGQRFQGVGSLVEIGIRKEYFREFIPEYVAEPGFLVYLRSGFGGAGLFFARGLQAVENVMTIFLSLLLPAIAFFSGAFRDEDGRDRSLRGPYGAVFFPAWAVVCAGSVLFFFVHYRFSTGSDAYWLLFSNWLLCAAAYPLMLERISRWITPRLLVLSAVPAFCDLAASVSIKLGYTPVIAGALSPALGYGAALLAVAAGAVLLSWFYPGRGAGGTLSWPREISRAPAWTFFVLCALLFVLFQYRVSTSSFRELFYLPTWLLGAAFYPVLLAEIKPRGKVNAAALLLVIPFIVALCQAPRYFYWAEEKKAFSYARQSEDTPKACSVLNSMPEDGKLYLSNILDRYDCELAARCRRRMYVSYTSKWDGKGGAVWETSDLLYSSARAEADDFFSGKMLLPCSWLKQKNIGYIYWSSEGVLYGYPPMVKKYIFLSKIYEGKEVSLYKAGDCGGPEGRRPQKRRRAIKP